MGQEAGGASIMHHLTYGGGNSRYNKPPRFNGAIIQSPGFWPQPDTTDADSTYATVLQKAGVASLDDLAAKSSEDLMAINTELVFNSVYGQYTFGPTIGGNTAPDLPSKLLQSGKYFKNIATFLGYTCLDGLLLTPPWLQSNEDLQDFFKTLYKGASADVLEKIGSAYPVTSPDGDGVSQRASIMQISNLLNVSRTTQWRTVLTSLFRILRFDVTSNISPMLH
jgi:carboxylesterase type B